MSWSIAFFTHTGHTIAFTVATETEARAVQRQFTDARRALVPNKHTGYLPSMIEFEMETGAATFDVSVLMHCYVLDLERDEQFQVRSGERGRRIVRAIDGNGPVGFGS